MLYLDTLLNPKFNSLDSDYYIQSNHTKNVVPYNFIEVDDSNYLLEFDVAGMEESDIDIEVRDTVLNITAKNKKKADKKYLLNYLPKKNFNISLTLQENVKVANANMKNGILTIYLEMIIPEEKKPRKIMLKN